MEVKFYNKYIVLKWGDCELYLTEFERIILNLICDIVEKARIKAGKKVNSYWVINQDEPYAEQVRGLIKTHALENE